MNELQEYTSTLGLDLDIEEKKRLILEWKEINKWDSEKLVKGTDVAGQDTTVASTNASVSQKSDTDLNSLDGTSPSLDRAHIDRIVNDDLVDFELIPERKGKDKIPHIDFDPESTEEVLKTLPINSIERTQYYIDNKMLLDDTVDKEFYKQSIGEVIPTMFQPEIVKYSGDFASTLNMPAYFADYEENPDLSVNDIPWEYNLHSNDDGIQVGDALNLDSQFRHDNTAEWFKQNYDFDPSATQGGFVTEEVTGEDGVVTEKQVYKGSQGYTNNRVF